MIGRTDDEPIRPLSPKEWSDLERKIASSKLGGPGMLVGLAAEDLASGLEIDLSAADRIAVLLGRDSRVETELERLSDRGIGVLTRVDRDYPSRLRDSLKHLAPPVL